MPTVRLERFSCTIYGYITITQRATKKLAVHYSLQWQLLKVIWDKVPIGTCNQFMKKKNDKLRIYRRKNVAREKKQIARKRRLDDGQWDIPSKLCRTFFFLIFFNLFFSIIHYTTMNIHEVEAFNVIQLFVVCVEAFENCYRMIKTNILLVDPTIITT